MIIPIPTQNEPEPFESTVIVDANYERIKKFLDVPDWKCTLCGAVMFGRMEYCINCKHTHKRHTPRPT